MDGREIVCWLFNIAQLILLARVILSWVPRPPEPIQPLARGVHVITEPVLAPLRRVLPAVPVGGVSLDLSVLVAFFLLIILQQAVC